MELNINPTALTNEEGTTFFEIKSTSVINIFGNLGVGTDIPLSDFHIENVQFDDKIIQIPTASNIYNYREPDKLYSLVPAGSIIIYPYGNTTHLTRLNRLGWYECNGQTLLGSNFPVLSTVLAGQFGNPNPVDTYITLPDFRDKIGIGSTVVGYISPEDNPIYASPSNLYSNTIINTINAGYNISLTYDNLPYHKHYIDKTSSEKEAGGGNGSHTHKYDKPGPTTQLLSGPVTARRGEGTVKNTNSIPRNTENNPLPSSGGVYGPHSHGEFTTTGDGKQSVVNTTTGSFTAGTPLTGEPISIRQAAMYMIYLIKCL